MGEDREREGPTGLEYEAKINNSDAKRDLMAVPHPLQWAPCHGDMQFTETRAVGGLCSLTLPAMCLKAKCPF